MPKTLYTGRDLPAIHDDEPVILIRAKHAFAPHLLRDLAARCEEAALPNRAAAIRAEAQHLSEWQAQHGSALPDDLKGKR